MNSRRGFKRLVIIVLIIVVLFWLSLFHTDIDWFHSEASSIAMYFSFPFFCLLIGWLIYCSIIWIKKGFQGIEEKRKSSKPATALVVFGFIELALLPMSVWYVIDFVWWLLLLLIVAVGSTSASIILGRIALVQIKKSDGLLKGKDQAVMGLITSSTTLIFSIFNIIMMHVNG